MTTKKIHFFIVYFVQFLALVAASSMFVLVGSYLPDILGIRFSHFCLYIYFVAYFVAFAQEVHKHHREYYENKEIE